MSGANYSYGSNILSRTFNNKNTQTINNDVMMLYNKKNYDALASLNLKQPINVDGDTIIHLMAKNLDKAGLELIMLKNPNAITYDIINFPNKKSKLPIHMAMETIKENNMKGDEFIGFMVNTLGANPEIPDNANRIIISNNINKNNKSIYDINKKNIEQYNKTVINNIRDLTKLASPEIQNFKTDEDFIKTINDHYLSQMMNGGYTGKRQISDRNTNGQNVRRYVADDLSENGNNNSFVSKNKNQIMENYDNNKNRNSDNKLRSVSNFMKQNNQYNKRKEELKIQEEKLRNDRLIGGNNMYQNIEEENRLYKQRNEMEKNYMIGGKKKSTNKKFKYDWKTEDFNLSTENDDSYEISNNNRNNKRSYKKGNDNYDDDSKHNWKTDDFILTTEDEDYDLERVNAVDNNSRGIQWDDNDNDDEDDDNIRDDEYDIAEDEYDEQMDYQSRNKNNYDDDDGSDYGENFDYMDMFDSQDRPRDTKIDDVYRSFVKKLMDVLGFDEETAKIYRSAIKIKIGEMNPELRKRSNDALKVKEMEKIFENEKSLKNFIKGIDIDKVKEYMAKQKEENEKRREEFTKKRENNPKKNRSRNKPRNKPNVSQSDSTENASSEQIDNSKKKNTKTSGSKAKETKSSNQNSTRKKTTQSRTVDDSYIKSDEIMFSPGY